MQFWSYTYLIPGIYQTTFFSVAGSSLRQYTGLEKKYPIFTTSSNICNIFTPPPFFTQVESSLALMVTVLFWSLLYDYKEAPSYSNLFVHLLQSVVVLIDQWVVSYIQILWLVFCYSFATQNTQKHTGLCRGDNGDLSQLGPLPQFPWSGAKFVFERVFISFSIIILCRFGWYSPWSTGLWGALTMMGTTSFTLFSSIVACYRQ